ncbi:hypothetical protein HETIRDRAFT_409305, partial [Heterobasidion irregulare TC 32-1]
MVIEEMSTCDKDEGVKRNMRRVKETEREGVKSRERVNQGHGGISLGSTAGH